MKDKIKAISDLLGEQYSLIQYRFLNQSMAYLIKNIKDPGNWQAKQYASFFEFKI